MHVDGQCHCGRIKFEAEVDPDGVGVCHCTDCQALSGSPWRASAPTRPGTFRVLTGVPRVYVKIAESGNRRAQGFCGECGSPIYATDPDAPVTYNLRLGAIRQRAVLAPKRQIWRDSALEWASDISRLPARAQQS